MAGSFSLDLTKFCNRYEADMRTVVRKIAFEAFKRIVLRTPVDTGRARANWSVSVGSPGSGTASGFDKSGGATLASAMAGVNSWSADGSIYLTNNVAYISTLEYGKDDGSPGSRQAPNGMVRVTLEEMQAWIQANAKKETIGSIREQTR